MLRVFGCADTEMTACGATAGPAQHRPGRVRAHRGREIRGQVGDKGVEPGRNRIDGVAPGLEGTGVEEDAAQMLDRDAGPVAVEHGVGDRVAGGDEFAEQPDPGAVTGEQSMCGFSRVRFGEQGVQTGELRRDLPVGPGEELVTAEVGVTGEAVGAGDEEVDASAADAVPVAVVA